MTWPKFNRAGVGTCAGWPEPMSNSSCSAWYVAMAKPNGERLALVNLERQGYRAWYPMYRDRGVFNGRLSYRVKPLFPRYIFIRVEHLWRSLLGTYGISRLVMSGSEPAKLSDSAVDGLRRRERNGLVELQAKPRFEPGDQVRAVKGVLAGQLLIYDGMSGKDRVRCLLGCLGQQAVVVLDGVAVEAA